MTKIKIKWRSFFLATSIGFGLINCSYANSEEENRYPGEYWAQYEDYEQAGFIPSRLAKVEKFYNKRAFAGLLIAKDGAIAVDWGENSRRFPVHSIRKSMLSALYGVHSADIDFQVNLMTLDVDDNGMLTEQERSATLLDILSSRSGVYLPAAAEGGQMVSKKPKRGSHPPGSHWYYNNWDFNVAGSIYTQLTDEDISDAFTSNIAEPLQMQDFRHFDSYYVSADSEHNAIQFRMSSRDLARFGLLYARNGRWQKQQIIPQDWIEKSTQALSQTDMGAKYPPHYGYMWWVENDGSYSARGSGGHILAVYPERDMVVVLRTNTYLEHSVSAREIKKILEGIVSASGGQPVASPRLKMQSATEDLPLPLPIRYKNKSARITLDTGQNVTFNSDHTNAFVNLGTGELELRYLSDDQFTIFDRQEPLEIRLSSDGKMTNFRTPRLFYLRAESAAKQGDLKKALYWVKEVISMLPESAMAYTNMAKIYIAQGDMDKAKKVLDKALKYEPNNQQANKLKKTIAFKQWSLPAFIAICVGLLLTVFIIFAKRRK